MWFWWFMLISDLLIPFLMILCGRLMWKSPPQNINRAVGYRTTRSMKNMETWKFAHNYCGRLWWRIGWIMLGPSILVYIPVYGKTDKVIGMVGLILMIVQLIVFIGTIVPTERALKNTFTKDGTRR